MIPGSLALLAMLLVVVWYNPSFFGKTIVRKPACAAVPGTGGMAGYKDYGMHVSAFLLGTVLLITGALAGVGSALDPA
jgi:hypothetical protein